MIDPQAITEAIREAHARRLAISLWCDHLGYWTAPYVEGDEARAGWLMVATTGDRIAGCAQGSEKIADPTAATTYDATLTDCV